MSYRALAVGAVAFLVAASGCNLGMHSSGYCDEDGYCGDPYYGDYGVGGTGGGMAGTAGTAGTAGGWGGGGSGGGAYCESDADCGAGSVCSPLDGCESIVANCPLTPECIGDPEGYTPEWQGWDPLFAGSFLGGDMNALVDAHIDFYETHVYGEGVLFFDAAGGGGVVQVLITGTRQGDKLYGQLIESSGSRTFDAVYEATMPSASEMTGTVTIASDLGEWVAEMHLYRTSPCGCATEATGCTQTSQCSSGRVCLDAECVQLCANEQECEDPSFDCVDFICQPAEPSGPCEPACAEGSFCIGGVCAGARGPGDACAPQDSCTGGTTCVEGVCQFSCTHSCDCHSGAVCSEGVCVSAPSQGPRPCESDCDCRYADGETCVDGFCAG